MEDGTFSPSSAAFLSSKKELRQMTILVFRCVYSLGLKMSRLQH